MPMLFKTCLLIFGIVCLAWGAFRARTKQKMSYREISIRWGLLLLFLFGMPMLDNLLSQNSNTIADYIVVMAIVVGDDAYHIHQIKVLKIR